MEDLTPLYNKEFYLAHLCGEDVVLPIPDGNAERYLAYLCGMDVTIPDVPDGRTETYLAYKCGEDVVLPDPMYRIEYYLAKWCGMDVEVPEPMYRIEYWLAQLANSGELKTVTGNPISVSDALAQPAESLVVDINPVQDLHGYANPWPAGGGKNLLDPDKMITYGNGNGRRWYYNDGIILKAGQTYTLSVSGSDQIIRVYFIDKASATSIIDAPSSVSYTPSEDTLVYLQAYRGSEILDTNNFQLELGSTATSWAPYENLCPITGWTGVNIPRTGKNLLDSSTKEVTSSAVARWAYSGFKLLAGQAYTLSSNNPSATVYITEAGTTTTIRSGSPSVTYTPTVDTDVSFRAYLSPSVSDVELKLELGSTATAYEPYTGTTYAISWQDEAGTVYGGELDVTTGVLTKAPYYASYNGETLVGPWVSSMDKYVSGATPTTGAQVVDLGGTGTDVQLTATEVQMLLGNNVIWNDVGDMVLEYLADGPADDVDALQILLGNRYVNNGAEDEATDREALEILLGGNTR